MWILDKHKEWVQEKEICRQIVTVVEDFGINQKQRLFLVYLLSLGLENIEHMKEITSLIRELGGAEVFLSDVLD